MTTTFHLSMFPGRSACRILLACLLPAAAALAQDYPSRPLTLIVPYPPGSATDFVARLLQPKLTEYLKQTVIIENKGGASTNIGAEFVARAAPDGYTVLIQAPNISTNEFAFANLRWKREDFAPVTLLVRWSNVLLAGPSANVRDIKQLVAGGKAASSGYNYGSSGQGSLSHLAVETLKSRSDLGMQHITFSGPAPMVTNLLGGSIQYGATNPASFMSIIKSGKYKVTPMAVLGSQRDPTIPDVPALSEFGITGIEAYGWLGALVPAHTPPAIIARLNTELLRALRLPEVQEKLKANYLEPTGSTPQEFAQFITAENLKWGQAFRAVGIKPE